MEAEVDALQELEERIRRTVELVTTLRAERDAARAELKSLEGERKQVRTRIEKLLGQMDSL